MQKRHLLCIAVMAPLCVFADIDESDIKRDPLSIRSNIELGQIVSGEGERRDPENASGQWISRLGVWLTQKAVVKERLSLIMGVGGSFWYAFPEIKGSPVTLVTKFGPAVSQATGIYAIGGTPQEPLFDIQLGYFPFKYNNDSRNLGEYLLRCGTYPGYLVGGGWSIIGDAQYRVQGIRAGNYLLDNKLQNQLLFSMERDFAPMYDFSLSLISKFDTRKMFSCGAGVAFNRLIPVDADKTTPIDPYNRYLNGEALGGFDGLDNDGNDTLGSEYYTFKGTKLMAQLALNPQDLLNISWLGKNDLKLYAEAAILGVKDYPFYYDDITKRIPVMFGFNLPTFKLLDVLAVEVEWYGSEFENSLENVYEYQIPLWKIPGDDPQAHDDTAAYRAAADLGQYPAGYTTFREHYQNDNWKWSIYGKRTINRTMSLFLQLACDNFRPKDFNAKPIFMPVTRGNSQPFTFFQNHWYFVFKLSFGI